MKEKMREKRLRLMDKALEIVEQAGKPVSMDYVAHNLGVSWHVARALLLELALKGKLKAIETTRGYAFMKANSVPEQLPKPQGPLIAAEKADQGGG
jgi:hypothetical protein